MQQDPAKLLCDLELARDKMTDFMAGPSAKGQAATGFMLQHHAEISIILSKLAELQTRHMIKQTGQLVFLTWAIAALTLVLAGLAVIQIKIMVQ